MIERIGSQVVQSLRQFNNSIQNTSKDNQTLSKKAKQETDISQSEPQRLSKAEKFKVKSVETVKASNTDDIRIAAEIRRLKAWEDHVIQHEHQHMLTGGEFASSPSYVYTTGPDGKRYIYGGEVSMSIPAGGNLEDTEAALDRVKRAAASPADPSPQDLKTAAMASAQQASIRNVIARKHAKQAYETSKQHELEIKEVKGDYVDPLSKFKFQEIRGFELFI